MNGARRDANAAERIIAPRHSPRHSLINGDVKLDERYVVRLLVDLMHFQQHRVLIAIELHHVVVHLNSDAEEATGNGKAATRT